MSKAPPIKETLTERCEAALNHIVQGLDWLEWLEERRDEEEERERKAREQHERDNPTMARPLEPIPMPYNDSSADSSKKVQTYNNKTKRKM